MQQKDSKKVYTMKTMIKDSMVLKNQVAHVRAERDVLAKATGTESWITRLYFSFQDKLNLHLVMEFMPGGDLMTLLMKEDIFSEKATMFYVAETTLANIHEYEQTEACSNSVSLKLEENL